MPKYITDNLETSKILMKKIMVNNKSNIMNDNVSFEGAIFSQCLFREGILVNKLFLIGMVADWEDYFLVYAYKTNFMKGCVA